MVLCSIYLVLLSVIARLDPYFDECDKFYRLRCLQTNGFRSVDPSVDGEGKVTFIYTAANSMWPRWEPCGNPIRLLTEQKWN